MKKILTLVFASAFALCLAAPIASACPGMDDGEKVVKKEKKEKPEKAKVVNKDKAKKKAKAKKKPVKVSRK